MGCCSSVKPDQVQVPTTHASNLASNPTPNLAPNSTFDVFLDEEERTAVLTRTGLALIVCEQNQSVEEIKAAKSNVPLNTEFFYFFSNQKVVAVGAKPPVPPGNLTFSCQLLRTGESLKIEGKQIVVDTANRHRIYYREVSGIKPGSPVYSGDTIVGLQDRPGRALTLNWLCSEIQCLGASAPSQLKEFLQSVSGTPARPDLLPRVYSVHKDSLVSCSIESDEFLDHVSGLPLGAKICYTPSCVFIAGGLKDKKPTNKVYLFDTANGYLMINRKEMNFARAEHCLCYLKKDVYCVSGKDTTRCEKYKITDDKWEELPEIQTPRVSAGAVAYQSAIYVIGGCDNSSVAQLLNSVWFYLQIPIPPFTASVVAVCDSDYIWICSKILVRWRPDIGEAIVKEGKETVVGTAGRLKDEALYVFVGKDMQEVRLDKDIVSWKMHRNQVENFP